MIACGVQFADNKFKVVCQDFNFHSSNLLKELLRQGLKARVQRLDDLEIGPNQTLFVS